MSSLLGVSYYIKTSWVIIIDNNWMYISVSLFAECFLLTFNNWAGI